MRCLLFVFLFCLLGQTIDAQIVFEHQYPGSVYRIKLQQAGEKYYDFSAQTQVISFYNSDHSFWKSFSLPFDTTGYYYVYEVTDQTLNSDSLIEVTCAFYANSGKKDLLIVNETGNTLLKVPGQSAKVSEIVGLSTKLLVSVNYSTIAVYSVPQLKFEYQFPRWAIRTVVDSLGEMYAGQISDSVVGIYQSDFSLYRSVAVPHPFAAKLLSVIHVSRHKILSDTLIEMVLKVSQNVAAILNEEGKLLISSYNAYNFQMSEIPGFPDKLCDYETIYALPGLVKEHTYKGFHPFRAMFNDGPNYVMGWNDTIRIFRSDHSLRAKIKADVSPGLSIASWEFYNDNLIDINSDIEIGYGAMDYSSPNIFERRIKSENGSNLFLEIQGNRLIISEIGGGTQNKLLSYITDTTGKISKTKIYALPTYDLTDIKKLTESKGDLVIFPNPASDYFELKLNNLEIKYLSIFDSEGRLINSHAITHQGRVKIDYLKGGVYLIVFDDIYGRKISKKLIKQ